MTKKIIALAMISVFAQANTYDSWYVGAGYDGVSVKKDLTKDYTIQATYGGFGDLSGFKGKVLYKFQQNKDYNFYCYGGFMYSSDEVTHKVNGGYGTSAKSEIDITTKGLEFGAGIEYDLRKTMNSNIPLFVSLELGYRASSADVDGKTTFDGYDNNVVINSSAEYDYSGVIGGLWIHYRF